MALFTGFVPLPTAYISKATAANSGQFAVADRYGRKPTFDQNQPQPVQSWNKGAVNSDGGDDLLRNPEQWWAKRGANVNAVKFQRQQQLERDRFTDKDFERATLTRRRFQPSKIALT